MKELMNAEITMNSLEIANLLDCQHSSVKRSIGRLIQRGVIQNVPLAKVENNQSLSPNNRSEAYIFSGEQGKRDSIIVVAQLSPEFTAALVDRWQELENQNKLQLPNFNDPAEAARAWADQFEQRAIAEKKLEDAKPALEFVDNYVDSKGLVTFRQACKVLQIKEAELRDFLLDNKIMYRLNGALTAYQDQVSKGRFTHKTGLTQSGQAFSQALFTPKGLEWIASKIAKASVRDLF